MFDESLLDVSLWKEPDIETACCFGKMKTCIYHLLTTKNISLHGCAVAEPELYTWIVLPSFPKNKISVFIFFQLYFF